MHARRALEEIEGDIFRGVVKVKLGAISTAFKGQANFVERDDTAHRAVLKAEGRDTTGKGNASALITAQLESIDAGTTKCVVETDLHITGKVAQFGRGIMGDVSKKLMNQFATNLNTMLDQEPRPGSTGGPGSRRSACRAPHASRRNCRDEPRSARPPTVPATVPRQPPPPPCARSTARPPHRSSCPTLPVRRSSSASFRWSAVWCCCGSSYDASAAANDVSDDVAAVRELIGRSPRGAFEVVVRDAGGDPVVLRNAPLLDDGEPMPTRYWLVGRREVLAVSRLESTGGVRRAEAELDPAEIADAHRRYAAERDAAVPADHTGPRPHGGVGGTRTGRQVPARPLRLVPRRRRRPRRCLGRPTAGPSGGRRRR